MARWSEIDLSDKSVEGGRTGIASLGLTSWLSPTFNFGLNYRHIRLDRVEIVTLPTRCTSVAKWRKNGFRE